MKLLILLISSLIFLSSCSKKKTAKEIEQEKIVLLEFVKRLEISESNPYHENLKKEDH